MKWTTGNDSLRWLYEALMDRWLEPESAFAPRGLPLDELLARFIRDGVEHRDMHRVIARESIEGVAYAADVRKLTGMDPASEEVAERYGHLVGQVIRRLAS